MKQIEKQSSKGSHKGLAVTAVLAAAATFAAAAIIYFRRKGISPKQPASALKRSARSAKGILSGEAKAAYDDVRALVIAELAKSSEKPTKQRVAATVGLVGKTLKKRGEMTKAELAVLLNQLRSDWVSMQREAAARKRTQ